MVSILVCAARGMESAVNKTTISILRIRRLLLGDGVRSRNVCTSIQFHPYVSRHDPMLRICVLDLSLLEFTLAWRCCSRSVPLRAASFVAAACLPSLAEAEFAAAPRHSRRWSPGWRHSWRRNPLVFVGSFRRCAGPHHRGSWLRTTKTNRPRTSIHPIALGWVQAFVA